MYQNHFNLLQYSGLVKGNEILSIRTTVADNNLKYSCLGRPLTITCTSNTTSPRVTVNNDQFFFLRGVETVVRNSFSVALTSFADNIAVITVHVPSLRVMQVVSKCLDITENVTIVQAAGKA